MPLDTGFRRYDMATTGSCFVIPAQAGIQALIPPQMHLVTGFRRYDVPVSDACHSGEPRTWSGAKSRY
jgi:hypothetical protein